MLSQLITLYRRRLRLLAGSPRELIVPLATPLLFALVIAPALNKALGSFNPKVNYVTYVAVASVVLLVPLNAMFTGISVFADRDHGGLRELLAAPLPRWLVPLGNVLATLTITGLQVVVLVVAAVLRGATLHTSAAGVAWFAVAAVLLAAAIAGVAEVLVFRLSSQEEYVGIIPRSRSSPGSSRARSFRSPCCRRAWKASLRSCPRRTHSRSCATASSMDRRTGCKPFGATTRARPWRRPALPSCSAPRPCCSRSPCVCSNARRSSSRAIAEAPVETSGHDRVQDTTG